MTRLEFFFDCSNPWTYLACHRIEARAAHMQELTVHPELIGRLRDGIPPFKTIEEEVDALTQLYGAVETRSYTSGFSL